mmetsp:Transcript_20878/g.63866  ORF Transcript_20878/g.63866 Transcript_20878/m.63866 type:complete len:218 (+) Transcript_20878:292-945(+)
MTASATLPSAARPMTLTEPSTLRHVPSAVTLPWVAVRPAYSQSRQTPVGLAAPPWCTRAAMCFRRPLRCVGTTCIYVRSAPPSSSRPSCVARPPSPTCSPCHTAHESASAQASLRSSARPTLTFAPPRRLGVARSCRSCRRAASAFVSHRFQCTCTNLTPFTTRPTTHATHPPTCPPLAGRFARHPLHAFFRRTWSRVSCARRVALSMHPPSASRHG